MSHNFPVHRFNVFGQVILSRVRFTALCALERPPFNMHLEMTGEIIFLIKCFLTEMTVMSDHFSMYCRHVSSHVSLLGECFAALCTLKRSFPGVDSEMSGEVILLIKAF